MILSPTQILHQHEALVRIADHQATAEAAFAGARQWLRFAADGHPTAQAHANTYSRAGFAHLRAARALRQALESAQ